MSTVFQAITLPVGGTTNTLGPAAVEAKWPAKPCKTGKMMRNITLSDSSGSIPVTLFGAPATWPIESGMNVVIKGNLKRGEYKGTPQLAGEDGLICEINGEAVQPAPQPGVPQVGAPAPVTAPGVPQAASAPVAAQTPYSPPVEAKISITELAGSIAMFLDDFQEALANTQISTEVQNKILETAATLPPLYWFGSEAKALKMADVPAVQVVDDAGNIVPPDVPF